MRATPVLLVLGSVVSVQVGQAFGKQLFTQAGPGAVVALRPPVGRAPAARHPPAVTAVATG